MPLITKNYLICHSIIYNFSKESWLKSLYINPKFAPKFRRRILHSSSNVLHLEQLDPFSLVVDELSLLANRLWAMVIAEVPKLASAAEYFFKMGVEGKRFHPMMITKSLLLITRQQHIAEIIEMIHVASLLHDDVLDGADARHGIGSLNFVMGNKVAVLAGDFLLSRACVALAALKNTEVVSLLTTVVEHLVIGETMQMTTTSEQRCSMEYYMQKTYYKTASLISNSYKAVALLARQTTEVAMMKFENGKNLGLAFQLIDDVLDFTGTSTFLRKGSLSDIRHNFCPICSGHGQKIQSIPKVRDGDTCPSN
ncbi:hypothetical protein K2173_001271 [Erythroxylum novogranatense]|uniref:Geranyl diphosphate synthase n=1 Tax=Erythroxylum novogranatense TaxID=1862640 RepID=A0AAV8T382_9ROSI|nr:hypothetical protein K2173_001271 [Erythroxylum novogranatense]